MVGHDLHHPKVIHLETFKNKGLYGKLLKSRTDPNLLQ